MMKVCSECLEKRLRPQIGQQVTAKIIEGKVYSGVLVGFHAEKGCLRIVLQEGKSFRVVDHVDQLSFAIRREEAS